MYTMFYKQQQQSKLLAQSVQNVRLSPFQTRVSLHDGRVSNALIQFICQGTSLTQFVDVFDQPFADLLVHYTDHSL